MATLQGHRALAAAASSRCAPVPIAFIRSASNTNVCRPSTTGASVASSSGRTAHQPGRRSTSVASMPITTDTHLQEVEALPVSEAATCIVQYAIDLARTSEVYEVHSWMVLLGILKYESCTAAKILKKLGLEDLYGAWHEVLWALNVSDGLKPRSFTTEITFADRAFKVITGANDFAMWHGAEKMYSEDLLMALAAGDVLDGLFPDLNLSFDRVRKAVEKETGRRYVLPDEAGAEGAQPGALVSADEVFL